MSWYLWELHIHWEDFMQNEDFVVQVFHFKALNTISKHMADLLP